MISSRFDINYYTNTIRSKTKSIPCKVSQNIQDNQFTSLVQKNHQVMMDILSLKKWQKILENKSITQMFLDKIRTAVGQWDPLVNHVANFGYSSSTFASMEIMRYLEQILESPELNTESRELIDQWLKAESEYLSIPILFDGLRSQVPGALDFIADPTDKTRARCLQALQKMESVSDPDDVKLFAISLVSHLNNMKPGEEFKMLGGHFIHETRIKIQKNKDGTYTLIHFNTGEGKQGETTGISIEKITPEKLENHKFWEQFIHLKTTQIDMKMMNELLLNLSPLYDPAGITATISAEYCIQSQKNNSCPFHSVKADFKHWFISNYSNKNIGIEQYKLITALIAKHATTEDKSFVDPKLRSAFEQKSTIKQRYLDWFQVAQDPEKYQQVKDKYFEILLGINPTLTTEELEQLIQNHTKVMSLSILDKKLSETAKNISSNEYLDLLEKAEEICKINGRSFLNLKQKIYIQNLKKFFKDTKKFHDSLTGKFTFFISWICDTLFPNYLSEYIRTFLFKTRITPVVFPDSRGRYRNKIDEQIAHMLHAAVKVEDPHVLFSFIQDLNKQKILESAALLEILSHVEDLTLAENIVRLILKNLPNYLKDYHQLLYSLVEPEKLVEEEPLWVTSYDVKMSLLIAEALVKRNDPKLLYDYCVKYPYIKKKILDKASATWDQEKKDALNALLSNRPLA